MTEMQPAIYTWVIDVLENAVEQDEDLLETEAELVLEVIRDEVDNLPAAREVSEDELCRAIRGWQTVQLDRLDKSTKRGLQ